METLNETTIRIRTAIDQYLKDAEVANEALKNFLPSTYRDAKDQIAKALLEQKRRLNMPPNVIFLDEIPLVLKERRRIKETKGA